MNESTHSTSPHAPAAPAVPVDYLARIDASCRGPLLALLITSAAWLVLGSVLSVIASVKFHGPGFLADTAWLTYGRVRPASTNCLLYGFCIPAGLAVGVWMLARLGRAPLALPIVAALGIVVWNAGVAIGVAGILLGDATGFETLEFPAYATAILLTGYLLLGLSAALTFHHRQVQGLYVSHWFLLAGLFWFPWIYSTAQVLVALFPGRGVVPWVTAWWYAENLQVMWFWLMGLAAVFYFVPRLTATPLHSRYLAMFTFWLLILFGGWGGIPHSAPAPSWMPVLSTASRMLLALTLLSIVLNLHLTLRGRWGRLRSDPTLRFMGVALFAFLISAVMKLARAVPPVAQFVDFTWFTVAEWQLNNYGFFALAVTGAIYHIAPRLVPFGFAAGWVRVHFWLASVGAVLSWLPLIPGGIIQGLKLQNPNVPFVALANSTLHFLRLATVGELLILAGNLIFLMSLGSAAARYYRHQAKAALADYTEDLFEPAEVKA